jgi:arylsulfatase A-like enzyme
MDFPGPWAEFLRARGYELPQEERFVIWLRESGPDYEDGAPHPKPWIVKTEHNDTTWHVDQAIDYVSAHRNEPWILHLSLLRPHPPWIASEPWNRLYDPEAMPQPLRRETSEDEATQHPWLAYQLKHPLYQAPGDIRKLNRMRAIYFAMMTEVDDNLGRLFEHLKHERLWDDTLIVFTSDHGEQLGDHWLLGKSSYFDATYTVPLIVRDPRAAADRTRGGTVGAFTEHVDIMPTLLEAIGADIPPQCDGRSLLPLIEGAAPMWRSQAHFEFDFRDASFVGAEQALGLTLHQCNFSVIRGERYKYVHFANLPPLLFDLERDPHEFTNLATAGDYAKPTLQYAQQLISWRLAHEDQTLTHMMATGKGMVARPASRL